MTPTKSLKSTRMKDALKYLPEFTGRIQNPVLSLPSTENIEDSYEETSANDNDSHIVLKGEGIENIIIPSNIFDIYTRLEILLGLKLWGHTNTLTEAII